MGHFRGHAWGANWLGLVVCVAVAHPRPRSRRSGRHARLPETTSASPSRVHDDAPMRDLTPTNFADLIPAPATQPVGRGGVRGVCGEPAHCGWYATGEYLLLRPRADAYDFAIRGLTPGWPPSADRVAEVAPPAASERRRAFSSPADGRRASRTLVNSGGSRTLSARLAVCHPHDHAAGATPIPHSSPRPRTTSTQPLRPARRQAVEARRSLRPPCVRRSAIRGLRPADDRCVRRSGRQPRRGANALGFRRLRPAHRRGGNAVRVGRVPSLHASDGRADDWSFNEQASGDEQRGRDGLCEHRVRRAEGGAGR